jgi:DNA-binding transcriptional LysR family regulator
MELRHLRYFIAVAEEGHFGRAAARVGISQPPLSQQIRELEAELKVQLFRRSSRRVELTPAGQAMLEYARLSIEYAEQGAVVARRMHEGGDGRLRVGYILAASYELLPRLLDEYRQRHPLVEVALEHARTPQIVQLVLDRKLDVGLLRPPVADKGLHCAVIQIDPYVAVLPRQHVLVGSEGIRVRDLRNERLLLGPRETTMQEELLSRCLPLGFSPPITVATGAHLLVRLVAEGIGIAVVPRFNPDSVISPVELRKVVVRPMVGLQARARLAVVWRRSDDSDMVRWFVAAATNQRIPHMAPLASPPA